MAIIDGYGYALGVRRLMVGLRLAGIGKRDAGGWPEYGAPAGSSLAFPAEEGLSGTVRPTTRKSRGKPLTRGRDSGKVNPFREL
jgi:hypothetical protein